MTGSPFWLFCGPEIGERNEAVEALRAETLKRCGSIESHTFYPADSAIGDIISLLQNGSLFSDARFVVIRNAEQIKKKDEVEQLLSWIAESDGIDDAVLVLVSDEIGIDKKLEGAAAKDRKKIFWEMFENRKEQWIRDFFRKAGYSIENEALASILELVENNTEEMRKACLLFTLFFPAGHNVCASDVDNILSHTREETAFTLFDALACGDLSAALGIFRKLALSGDSGPIATLAGLSWCFRRLDDWHRLAAAGTMDDFSLKKAGFASRKAQEQYRLAGRRWSAAATERIIALLAATDLQLRSGGTALADTVMELCLLSIVLKEGQPCAKPDYASFPPA